MLLVVDLEATCWKGDVPGKGAPQTVDDMEVIEIGCVLLDDSHKEVAAERWTVRPVCHPALSRFCESLTGITQQEVARAEPFPDVVQALDAWASQMGCIDAWASWGEYDRHQLEAEYGRHGVAPFFLELPHHNIKQLWQRCYGGTGSGGVDDALRFHGMDFEGRIHRALADAKNIARLIPLVKEPIGTD